MITVWRKFAPAMKHRILLLISLWLLPAYLSIQVYTPAKSNTRILTLPYSDLNLENVYEALVLNDIKYPEIVMQQIIVETMWLKCKNCSKEFNNLFGFYLNGQYMKFDTWYESIEYYKKWQDQFYKDGDYYQFLVRIGYATSPNYVGTLKQVIVPEFNS